jgi:fructose/tagatose bisphosphate aldolase
MDIDALIRSAVFSESEEKKTEARATIHELARQHGAISSSINGLYRAFGRGEAKGFTVPAFNIRTLTYDTARVVFRLAQRLNAGAFIFEIARSEMGYTMQRPAEYSACILAAALKENYVGPIFIQGDHFQVKREVFTTQPEEEIKALQDLIDESIKAGFYNIDIDASTMVDLYLEDLIEQQKPNFEITALLTRHIRRLEQDTTISIGGEIGHIGGKNSTVADFEAFMKGYNSLLHGDEGISKVSVQTGTSHGGTPTRDGKIADVKLDFSVLKSIGEVARGQYGLGGAVQHGASTLPNELFGEFVTANTLEIHLATGFQNIVFDTIPEALRKEMETWTMDSLSNERSENMTDQQFFYKSRKKALGPFKKQLWDLPAHEKANVLNALEKQFAYLFEKLQVVDIKDTVEKYVQQNS